ncbi:hypothetical protein [Sulfurimonas sp. NW9]|uniref:hypothetical protein n=1 Tax=Sulfurimonas sp. NW9 TaxID=2922728 RepID=UPI003DA7AC65
MSKDLYTELEEINEDEGIYTIGDDLCNTFMNGNFTTGVEEMKELNITSKELLEYLEEKAEEYGCELKELYYGHFTADFWIALGSENI